MKFTKYRKIINQKFLGDYIASRGIDGVTVKLFCRYVTLDRIMLNNSKDICNKKHHLYLTIIHTHTFLISILFNFVTAN